MREKVRMLMVSLTKEEKALLAEELAKEQSQVQLAWSTLGPKLAQGLLAAAHRKFAWPARLLSYVFRSCGHHNRRRSLVSLS